MVCRDEFKSNTYQSLPSDLRGNQSERAIPTDENGLPTCCLDQFSMTLIDFWLQPIERYW